MSNSTSVQIKKKLTRTLGLCTNIQRSKINSERKAIQTPVPGTVWYMQLINIYSFQHSTGDWLCIYLSPFTSAVLGSNWLGQAVKHHTSVLPTVKQWEAVLVPVFWNLCSHKKTFTMPCTRSSELFAGILFFSQYFKKVNTVFFFARLRSFHNTGATQLKKNTALKKNIAHNHNATIDNVHCTWHQKDTYRPTNSRQY